MEALVIEMTDGASCTHEQSGNSCGGGGGRPICGTFPETQICFCRDETASVRTVCPPEDRHTHKGEPEPGLGKKRRLGVGPGVPSSLSFTGCILCLLSSL